MKIWNYILFIIIRSIYLSFLCSSKRKVFFIKILHGCRIYNWEYVWFFQFYETFKYFFIFLKQARSLELFTLSWNVLNFYCTSTYARYLVPHSVLQKQSSSLCFGFVIIWLRASSTRSLTYRHVVFFNIIIAVLVLSMHMWYLSYM